MRAIPAQRAWLGFVIGLSFAFLLSVPSSAQALQKCPSAQSLEGRLVMEQWAPLGGCDKPTVTRVTDRFLGLSCREVLPESPTCRAFLPPPGSRAFDSSRVFRCVDLGMVPTEMGSALMAMREWVVPSKQCDWSQAADVLAMEVDFARAQVCAGNLCMPAAKLTLIGQQRLRHLVEKALRDLDLVSSSASLHSATLPFARPK